MSKARIGTGTVAGFFERGKRLAQQADQDEPLADTHIISFEDPLDAAQLLTQARIGLFRAIKSQREPASITHIAAHLHRDRSAVKRDIDALAAAGLVSVETAPNPGHGTLKVVRAVASRVALHVVID